MSNVDTAAAPRVVVASVEVDSAVAPAASDAPAAAVPAAVPAAPPAPVRLVAVSLTNLELPILSSRYNLRLTSHRFANLPRSTASPSVPSQIFSSPAPSLPASSRASPPVSVTGMAPGLLSPVEIQPPPLDGHRARSSTTSSSSSPISSGSSSGYSPPDPEAEKGQESDQDESGEATPSPVDKARFGKGKARARPSPSSTRRCRRGSLLNTVTPSIENAAIENAAKRVKTMSSRGYRLILGLSAACNVVEIAGTGTKTTWLFRQKLLEKEILAEARLKFDSVPLQRHNDVAQPNNLKLYGSAMS
ncbi:hypothetical protein BCR39DRAFT_504984 [Naematelia encephala]|uniref:Uncharacterized protein n=1 Tax=Naematelia encephala TaxID=71784 RepID=A0A1Y2B8Q1_9TREE|nr:hypothetical protein BCR39DRAFT_504984 [Naematelia encephala]